MGGRTPIMDIEKEIKKAIVRDDVNEYFNEMILKIDRMSKNIAKFNKGYDLHGRFLRSKLAELTQYTIEFRKIVQEVRYHRREKKKRGIKN